MNDSRPTAVDAYEEYFVPAMFAPWSGVLTEVAALGEGERVLDVACGTGIVARTAAPHVGKTGSILAVDMNPLMLAVGRRVPPPSGAAIEWIEGNALALPIESASMDVTLCQHALTFIPDRVAALREMKRVLTPGGRALTMVLQSLALHPVFDALMNSVARHLEVALAFVDIPFALPDPDELATLHREAGFSEVEVLAVSATMRFPEPARFVPMAVMSSAAAVPAFALLDDPQRLSLMEAIASDCAGVIRDHTRGDLVVFDMHANVAIARA